jgi:hypothetical protein
MCACCFVSGVWSLVLASRMSYLASSALAAATARVTLDLFRVDAMISVFCFHRSATRVDLVRGPSLLIYIRYSEGNRTLFEDELVIRFTV